MRGHAYITRAEAAGVHPVHDAISQAITITV